MNATTNDKYYLNFTDEEFSKCLNVLYGPKDPFLGQLYDISYKSINLSYTQSVGGYITARQHEMNKIILKINALKLVHLPGASMHATDIIMFDNTEGENKYTKVCFTNKQALNIFKEAIYNDLKGDKEAWERFNSSLPVKKSAL